MATEFSVTIKLGDKILKALNQGKYSLCLQKYVDDGGEEPVANIVAAAISSENYNRTNKFHWIDNYEIAATNTPYEEGGYLPTFPATHPLSISTAMEDAFVLTDWNNAKVVHGQIVAPKNGFAFSPSKDIANPGASAAVYTTGFSGSETLTTASRVPFYMSPLPCRGGSHNPLIPLEKVILFFYRGEKEAKMGSMITQGRAYKVIIDLTLNREQSWKLNDDETWAPED